MTLRPMPDPKLIRVSIALVWLYQGLRCKLLGGVPQHEAVVAAAPFIGPAAAGTVVVSRTFAEPDSGTAANWATLDRSMLWGVVDVRPIAIFGNGGKPCSIC